MPKQWKEDQIYLLHAIEEYRDSIAHKDLKETRLITTKFAERLHEETTELHHRSVQSIVQRMPYLDNLLAGALSKENYAVKDRSLYASRQRKDGDKQMNMCNTRHSYNGALR